MILKSETTLIFKNFYKLTKKQFDTKVKCVQFDWGGQYRPLAQYLTSQGISFRHTYPHKHQQNGRAECKHRQIMENRLTLLAYSGMPFQFWWLTFQTSVYLSNRLPSTALHFTSPFQVLFQRTLNYLAFRVFGCATYPYLRPYHTQKFNFHTEKCVFVSYSLCHKGFKCMSITRRVYITQSVRFNESGFLFLHDAQFK